jgi:eukaryotic-like serine/threonine-protein kinase
MDAKRDSGGRSAPEQADPAISETFVADRGTSNTLVADSGQQPSSGRRPRASAPTVGRAASESGGPGRGDAIGRFVALGVLGTGGMGVVYSAYDPHLDRKVAIKLLNAEALAGSAEDLRARLLREAQAMAKIRHPNVVTVHEVGTLGEQVYVAMEFCDGGTLRAWLGDDRSAAATAVGGAEGRRVERRDWRAIVELFMQAGRGLAAAHAAGLVHRDFKPDNVLLAADGSARVTDFGLVTALGAEPSAPARARTADPLAPTAGRSLSVSSNSALSQDLTRTGSIMGTPSYMAPEQFLGEATTARTDQFAFCVALHEAIYGVRPFAGDDYYTLCEHVTNGTLAPVPKHVHAPAWLRRVLLRGMSVAPAARFASMNDLLAALARGSTRGRTRALVAAGATVVALAGGGAAFAMHARSTSPCAGAAEHTAAAWNPARRDAMQAAFAASKRPLADSVFEHARAIVDAWVDQWQAGFVAACQATRVTGEQSEHLLDLRVACLNQRLGDARATLDAIAVGGDEVVDRTMTALTALPAIAPCGDTGALLSTQADPTSPVALVQRDAVRALLADARGQLRLARYSEGLVLARKALAAARSIDQPGAVAEALFEVGRAQHELGDRVSADTLRDAMRAAAEAGDTPIMLNAAANRLLALVNDTSDLGRAQELGDVAEALAKHSPPPVDIAVRLQDTLGLLERARGKLAEARTRYEHTLALAEAKLGADDAGTLTTVNQLGTVLLDLGRFDEARAAFQRVVDTRERQVGKDHPDVASALNNLGNAYRRAAKYDDAERVYQRALAIRRAALGDQHPDVAVSYENLGVLAAERNDERTALEYYRKALAIEVAAYGDDSGSLVGPLLNLGSTLQELGEHDEALADIGRALAIAESKRGHDDPSEIDIYNNLGNAQQTQGKLDDAFASFEHARVIAERVKGPDSGDVVDILLNEAVVYNHQHKPKDALALDLRALPMAEKAYGKDHPRVAMLLFNLGLLQNDMDKPADALASQQRSLEIFEKRFGKDHFYVSYALMGIAAALVDLKRAHEALPVAERALAIREKQGDPSATAEAHAELADVRAALGDRSKAREAANTALALYEKAGAADRVAEMRRFLAKH